MNGAVCI